MTLSEVKALTFDVFGTVVDYRSSSRQKWVVVHMSLTPLGDQAYIFSFLTSEVIVRTLIIWEIRMGNQDSDIIYEDWTTE